jgi:hypothetical protein
MKTGFSTLIVAQASAVDYLSYPKQHSYAGHGGTDIDSDDSAPSGLDVAMCEKRCDADEACDCVSFRPSDGKCWKRSACDPDEFEADSNFDTYVKSSGYVTYHQRSSHRHHGGIEIDDNNTAPGGISLVDCQARCNTDMDCGCVTFHPEDGRCFKRAFCSPVAFGADTGCSTYVKKGEPLLPSLTPPAPAPPYSYDDGLALAHLLSATYCGKDNFNSWNVHSQLYDVDSSKVRWIQHYSSRATAGVGRMNNPDGCFVAIRGTDGWIQVVLDAIFLTAKFNPDTCEGCKVHKGFELTYNSIKKKIFRALEEFGCEGKELYLTGHSLGGAVMHLLLYDVLEANYTVAYATAMESPRPGNHAFADALKEKVEATGTKAWRVTHNKDIFTRLPPRGLLNYVHALPEIFFGARDGKDFQNCGYDDMSRHCVNHWLPWQLSFKDHCWYADQNPCWCGGMGAATASNTSVVV